MRSVYTAHDVENEVQRMCDLSSVMAREEGIEFGELKTTVKCYRKRSHASEAPPVQICPVPYPSLPAKKQALFCISPKIRLAS